MSAMPLGLSANLFEALQYFLPRLLFTRTRWGDIVRALERFPAQCPDPNTDVFWIHWKEGWSRLAEQHLASAAASPHPAGRRHFLRLGAECLHWAEFMYFCDAPEKWSLRARMLDAFDAAQSLSPVRLEKGTVAGRTTSIPYYLILPPGPASGGRLATVFLSNGLDSTKEVELMVFAEHFLARGLAVVLFDGPGQGLNLGRAPMIDDFEVEVAALVDRIVADPRLDSQRLGFFGVSYGGYLALRVARRLGPRFRAVVNLSGGPIITGYQKMPRRIREDFKFAFMESTDAAMDERIAASELPMDGPWGTSVMSIHGALDHLFPLSGLVALDRSLGDQHRLLVYPREAHVCLNHIEEIMNHFADWMWTKLAATGSELLETTAA